MKLAYLNLIQNNSRVRNNQIFNTLNSLSKLVEVTYYSNRTKKSISKILKELKLKQKFSTVHLPIIMFERFFFTRIISVFLYTLVCSICLRFKEYDYIYIRDLRILFVQAHLPGFLKIKQPIIFEPHKIGSQVSSITPDEEKKALKQASIFFPISKGIKKELIRTYEISNKYIHVVPDGVNLKLFNEIRPETNYLIHKHNIPKNNYTVVYTGSFQSWKGVETLVLSSKYISKNTTILLLGGFGKDKKRIEELVKKEKYSNIIIKGHVDQEEVIKTVKSADVAVIPNNKTTIGSKYTSPLKLFEYMACGAPIVASNLSAMREVLKEKRNCLFFEAENHKDLAKKINILLKRKVLRTTQSSHNRMDVKTYSWDSRAKQIIQQIR